MDLATRPSAPSTPARGGSRHLKRLSLSIGSASPLSASSSASSSRVGSSPASVSAAGTPTKSHAPRHLRLSMSGPTQSYPVASLDSPADRDEPAAAAASASASASASPTAAGSPFPRGPPAAASASPRGSGHARRTSSISYSSSREPDDPRASPSATNGAFAYQSPAAASPSPSAAYSRRGTFGSLARSPQTHSPASSSPTFERFRGGSISSFPHPPLGEVVEEDDRGDRALEHRSERSSPPAGFLSSSRTGASIGAQPTLTELNSDLLNFIAKKERKCLDLREELKRHEAELKHLKSKWESIVAKSLASASPPTTTSLPRPSVAAEAKRLTREATSALPPLPGTSSSSTSPRPAPTHTLDLSLLSSTFDPGSFDAEGSHAGQDIDLEIGESVQAAKAWVGGVFGKLIDSVSGIDDQLPPIQGAIIDEGHLDVLREEDEPEESTSPASPERKTRSHEGLSSAASASSIEDNRRDSRASTMSAASVDSSSSFFGSFAAASTHANGRPRSNSGGSGGTIVVPTSTSSTSLAGASSTSSNSQSSIFSLAMGLVESPPMPSPEPPSKDSPRPRTRPAAAESGHARRRSTFDVLGAAAGGGWKSLSGRWAAVQDSETFKGTKRATLGFVDQFERTLTETLGPLDPLGSPPSRSREAMVPASPLLATSPDLTFAGATPPKALRPAASWSKAAPLSSAKRASSRSPDLGRGGASPESASDGGPPTSSEWDWSAFLDGVAPTPAAGSVPTPHIGGYRRPSLTPTPAAKAKALARSSSNPSLLDDDASIASSVLAPSSPSTSAKAARPPSEPIKGDDGDEWGLW